MRVYPSLLLHRFMHKISITHKTAMMHDMDDIETLRQAGASWQQVAFQTTPTEFTVAAANSQETRRQP
jgi:hypothetical protein